MPRRHRPRIWRRKTGPRRRMRGEPVRSARRLPPAKPAQGKQQQRNPNVTTSFKIPLSPTSCAAIQVPRGNMHSSARSELKTGLADSRIETKLPINEGGLLHVCLTTRAPGCPHWSAGQRTGLSAGQAHRGRPSLLSLSREFARVYANPKLIGAHFASAPMVNFDHFPEISRGRYFQPVGRVSRRRNPPVHRQRTADYASPIRPACWASSSPTAIF